MISVQFIRFGFTKGRRRRWSRWKSPWKSRPKPKRPAEVSRRPPKSGHPQWTWTASAPRYSAGKRVSKKGYCVLLYWWMKVGWYELRNPDNPDFESSHSFISWRFCAELASQDASAYCLALSCQNSNLNQCLSIRLSDWSTESTASIRQQAKVLLQ